MPHFFDTNVPPYIYLSQVVKHCPNAAYLYLELWRSKDKNHLVKVIKKEIQTQFLIPFYKFEKNLLQLVQEGLISVQEKRNTIKSKSYLIIEVVNFEEGSEDDIV